jgi:hypothetical protein
LIYAYPKELHGLCEVPCYARVKRGLSVQEMSMLFEYLGRRRKGVCSVVFFG